jgi:protein-tyrosine phosphatase
MWSIWRYNSRGYNKDPPVQVHPKILFGPGEFLTPKFVEEYKITHVINCAQEEYSPSWFKEKHRENYFCLNAIDSHNVKILSWYSRFKLMLDIFIQEEGVTYVHCQAGINRSGFLVMAYLVFEKNYDPYSLEKMIIKKRPCALTNTSFRTEIYQKFGEKLIEHNYK